MRILYVEDQADLAKAFQILLKRNGHEVEVAHTAAEAKRIFADRVFDLLILDLGLPDEHGGNLLRTLRRMSDIKAIAMTGHAQPHEVEEGIVEDEFDAYLTKPVTLEQVLKAISQLN